MEWYWIVTIIIGSFCALIMLSTFLYKQFFKRFYDIVLSSIAIIVLSPLLIILTIIGAIAMRGNPLFFQPRPGKINPKTGKEKIFFLVKFRTMSNKRDSDGNLLPDSARLNSYGRFLRCTSLDELPELFTILCGNMSIVGPRPQLVRDLVFMSEEQRKRHVVNPGLTGLAQVSGRNNITWERKFEIDLEYIDKLSFWVDLKIVFLTVFKVIKRSDVVREGTDSDIDFGDWLLLNQCIDREFYMSKLDESNRIIRGIKRKKPFLR